ACQTGMLPGIFPLDSLYGRGLWLAATVAGGRRSGGLIPPCSASCRLPAPARCAGTRPPFGALYERASTQGLPRPHSDQEGRMNNPRRKQRLVVGMLVGTLAIGLPPSRVHAFSAGPAKFAGVATMVPADG